MQALTVFQPLNMSVHLVTQNRLLTANEIIACMSFSISCVNKLIKQTKSS
jgi:predicted DNA-binding transcriptional regulator AlpA